MEIVTIHTAKTSLSRLLARVEAGEEILLARGKQPIAKLVPFRPPARMRKFGALKDSVTVSEGFFDPLPEQELGSSE
jgi:prevent-host-death family protein